MGSSTNRNLQAKFEKSKLQRIEAGAAEYSKPAYSTIAPAYSTDGVAVVRIEQSKKLVIRSARIDGAAVCYTPTRPYWDERQHGDELLVSARYEVSKPLRGKAAERARLRQHF